MKKYYYIIGLLLGFLSCDNNEMINSYSTLDDEQYIFYVADALDAMNMKRPEGSYNYPCLPGMDTWKELKTGEEIFEVCQVPEKILKNQSTQAVIQALWEHPSFPMIITPSSDSRFQPSLERFLFGINAYQELTKRTDAGTCLLLRYFNMALNNSTHCWYLNTLHYLLAQPVFLKQLSKEEKVRLIEEVICRLDTLANLESSSAIQSSYFSMGRIMVDNQDSSILDLINKNPVIKDFITIGESGFITKNEYEMIKQCCINFINNN